MIQTLLVAFECAALFCWTAFELWGALVNPFCADIAHSTR
jgi:hypothetical protein